MKKHFAITIAATGTALSLLPLFAAFEAHVVNVTARIENALAVSTAAIDFGTVFPQEKLGKSLLVELSQSFIDEGRVDDVNYFIRQKPKCGVTTDNGTVLVGPTGTGHVNVNPSNGEVTIDCGPDPRPIPPGEQPLIGEWGLLPSLCEYISKEDDKTPDNDGSLASFHQPFQVVNNAIQWLDTHGRLAKSENDLADNWTIDLAVPCFGGYCAQDWENFVHGINPQANPADYTQPIANEHKVFGCDLWVEVSGVSCAAEETTQTIVSDTTNTVPENGGAAAQALSFIHAAWTASIPGATWIWEHNPVQNPGINETFSFEKQFTPSGTVSGAVLNIATDNTYQVYVNNVLTTCASADEDNFHLGTQDTCNLLPYLQAGTNTLKVEVTNIGIPGSTPTINPAGVLYKLTMTEESSCTEE